MKSNLSIIILTILIIFNILLSEAIAVDECSNILSDAVDISIEKRNEDKVSALRYELCSITFEEHSKNYGAKAEATYKFIGGSGSYNKNSYNKYKSEKCENIDTYDSRLASNYYYSKFLSGSAISAWRECMIRKEGLSCWVEKGKSEDAVIFFLNYKSDRGTLPTIKRTYLSEGAVSQWSSTTPGGQLIPQGEKILHGKQSIVITRNESKAITVTINAELDQASITCKAFVPAAPIKAEPITSDLKSCIEYQHSRPDEVACNGNTEDGYYWIVGRKLLHYSVGGTNAVGNEPMCNSSTVGSTAMTSRFPCTQNFFQPVNSRWVNVAKDMTAPGCDYIGAGQKCGLPRGEICGIFQSICTKQP